MSWDRCCRFGGCRNCSLLSWLPGNADSSIPARNRPGLLECIPQRHAEIGACSMDGRWSRYQGRPTKELQWNVRSASGISLVLSGRELSP